MHPLQSKTKSKNRLDETGFVILILMITSLKLRYTDRTQSISEGDALEISKHACLLVLEVLPK